MRASILASLVILVALATFLSPGCFDSQHQTVHNCVVNVNVVVDNNPSDQHEFTHLVELIRFDNDSSRQYVCDSSHTVCDHQTCDQSHQVCNGYHTVTTGYTCSRDRTCTCPSGYSLDHGICKKYHKPDVQPTCSCPSGYSMQGDQCVKTIPTNGQCSWGDDKTPITEPQCTGYATVCDHYVCSQSHTVCDSGHYETTWHNTSTVVDLAVVTDMQSDPATVTLNYQDDGFFDWHWHIKWTDRYGVHHDHIFNNYDPDKTYVIRVSDVDLDPLYGAPQSQTQTTDVCGGGITFHYTGPFCPQTPCPEGTHCEEGTCVVNPPVTCDPACGEGYDCIDGQCVVHTEGGGVGTSGGESGGGSGSLGGWGAIFWHTMTVMQNHYDVYYWSSSGTTQEFIRITDPDGVVVRYENVTDTATNQTGLYLPLKWFGFGNYYLDKPKVWTVELLGIDSESPLPRVLSTDKAYANEVGPDGRPIPQTVRTFIRIGSPG